MKRSFRLQVSLRMLLLLMLLVGIGLTVYRWPWVEVERVNDPFAQGDPFEDRIGLVEQRITYRRNWRGEKVKSGLSQTFINDRLRSEQHFYEGEYHGPLRQFDSEGSPTVDVNYRHGTRHGMYRVGNGGTWIVEGAFVNGMRQGECKYRIDRDSDNYWFFVDYILEYDFATRPLTEARSLYVSPSAATLHTHWQNGQRHGRWRWDRVGKVPNSWEYDNDEIVRWDDEPIVEQFWQLLRSSKVNDPQLVAEWTAANQTGWSFEEFNMGNRHDLKQCLFSIGDQRMMVHVPIDIWGLATPDRRGRLVPALCEFAARNERKIVCRYGSLWLVSPHESESPFVDWTGVSLIRFPEGSAEERDWNALVPIGSSNEYAAKCIAQLFDRTAIAYEFEGEPALTWQDSGQHRPHLFTRRRRDVLGYLLYMTGRRCELHGKVLRILPQPGHSKVHQHTQPLAPMNIDPFG